MIGRRGRPRFSLARSLGVGSIHHRLHTLQQFLW
jgi:hypothetical protein